MSPAVAGLALLLVGLQCAHAEKYALLIGIGLYSPAPGVNNLEGPVNDAKSLRQLLVSNWHFKPNNIQTLYDTEATHARILAAIDGYADSLRPGDFLFLFYSGHGTSWFAPGAQRPEITMDTGAIVSSDLGLIVGARDLQPRLREVDAVAQIFAVFDSCYSGNSIKTVAVAPARYVSPEALKLVSNRSLVDYDRQFEDFQRFTSAPEVYPYRHTLYLSAASKAEQAADIPRLLISQGFRTVDGLPHGALTNSLLRGLRGEADTNHDGKITYEELYQFVKQAVNRQFPQTPQFLFPPGDPVMKSAPVFSVAAGPEFVSAAVARTPGKIRVKLEGCGAAMRARVAGTGVALSEDIFDLLIRQSDGGYELYHQSGVLIRKYSPGTEADLLLRLNAEPELRKFIDISYRKQSFNVSLNIEPTGRGFYKVGERLAFRVKSEADSYLLLLNIDISGMITLLYPRSVEQITLRPAGAEGPIVREMYVMDPVGMEYLKLFAFREKPPGLEAFVRDAEETFAPGSPSFKKLVQMVEADVAGRAAAQAKLVTME